MKIALSIKVVLNAKIYVKAKCAYDCKHTHSQITKINFYYEMVQPFFQIQKII